MGRPQDPKRTEAKLAEVTAATLRVIARDGIEGASLRAIAREGGFTTGTLVYYFRNKQDILLFAGHTVLQGVVSRMQQKVAASPSLDSLEKALVGELPTTAEKRLGWSIWLAFTAQAVSVDAFRQEHEQRSADFREIVRNCLNAEYESGGLAADLDCTTETYRLLAVFDGLGLHALLEPTIYPASVQQQLVHQAVSRLKRGKLSQHGGLHQDDFAYSAQT